MNTIEYKKHVKALRDHAMLMSVQGIQDSIRDDWKEPKWPAILFDAMCDALEKKMGKKAYAKWFDSLADVESVGGDV